jgi:hypothetical protein
LGGVKDEEGGTGMISNVHVRSYRPPQISLRTDCRKVSRFTLALSGEQRKIVAVMVVGALIAGLAITHFFSLCAQDAKVRVEQLQTLNTTVGNENVRLLATRAQLASKNHVVALAGVKLNLFVPEKTQVHRM